MKFREMPPPANVAKNCFFQSLKFEKSRLNFFDPFDVGGYEGQKGSLRPSKCDMISSFTPSGSIALGT